MEICTSVIFKRPRGRVDGVLPTAPRGTLRVPPPHSALQGPGCHSLTSARRPHCPTLISSQLSLQLKTGQGSTIGITSCQQAERYCRRTRRQGKHASASWRAGNAAPRDLAVPDQTLGLGPRPAQLLDFEPVRFNEINVLKKSNLLLTLDLAQIAMNDQRCFKLTKTTSILVGPVKECQIYTYPSAVSSSPFRAKLLGLQVLQGAIAVLPPATHEALQVRQLGLPRQRQLFRFGEYPRRQAKNT